MTKDRLYLIVRLIIIFVVCFIYSFYVSYPEFKKNLGSSDRLLNLTSFEDMLEINVNNELNFALLINSNKKITNLIFFEKNSLILYNKNIENNDLTTGINKIVTILEQNKYLPNDSNIALISYENNYLEEVKKNLSQSLNSKNIQANIQENINTYENKLEKLQLDSTSDKEEILQILDLYSKEVIATKDEVAEDPLPAPNEIRNYAYNVYLKIEKYIKENNIYNLDKSQITLPITSIPADKDGKIFPLPESWYYVTSGQVYAYIKFNIKNIDYDYCYQGSIDNYKKGEC